MKKLLKSILIATASVGAIAGSTAAVVSCGNSANQLKDSANGLLNLFADFTGTGNGLSQGTQPGDADKKTTLLGIIAITVKKNVEELKKTPQDGAPDCSKIDATKITPDNFTATAFTAATSSAAGLIKITWKAFGTDGSSVVTDEVTFKVAFQAT